MSNIYVGMSGGVDSSLTAALLKEQGHTVTGVYLKNWAKEWDIFDCPWADDLHDASQVAEQLGIELKVFDVQKDYHHFVVDYMLGEYKAGRTPNPDIMCNQEMKFGVFLRLAEADGADGIATGHYAQIKDQQLLAGIDKNKDQSYFLYRISPESLTKAHMPIGQFTKPEVRKMAADRGLVTASKKDSQGICFIGKVPLKKFLQQYVDSQPGPVIDQHGTIVGEHDGAIFYTIGQRSGLGIGGGKPYFITGKDMGKNEIYVTTDPQDNSLWRDTVTINQLHWLNHNPDKDTTYQIRARYRAPLVEAVITKITNDTITFKLGQSVRAIAPGQSLVMYKNDRVVGGGIIT